MANRIKKILYLDEEIMKRFTVLADRAQNDLPIEISRLRGGIYRRALELGLAELEKGNVRPRFILGKSDLFQLIFYINYHGS